MKKFEITYETPGGSYSEQITALDFNHAQELFLERRERRFISLKGENDSIYMLPAGNIIIYRLREIKEIE